MKYEYKKYTPKPKDQVKLEKFIIWLYQHGLTAEEISTLRWRNVDEYDNPPMVKVQRCIMGIKYTKKITITEPLAIWIRNSPYYGHFIFYKYLPNSRSKVAATRLGELYTAKEIEAIAASPQTQERVGSLVRVMQLQNRTA